MTGESRDPEAGINPTHGEMVRLAEKVAVLILLALLLYGVLRVLAPFGMAIAFGAFIAIGTWPARDALVRAGLRRGVAALVLLLLLILLVALPVLVMAPDLVQQVSSVVVAARAALANLPEMPPSWVAELPLVGGQASRAWTWLHGLQGDLGPLVEPYSGQLARLMLDLAEAAAGSVVQVLLALVVASMFWMSGDRMVAELRDIAARLGGATGVAAVAAAGGAVRGVAWGVVGTGILQAVLMGMGLAVAGVPGAAVLGFLTMIFSISQVLGPLVVVTWGGAAAWLYGQDQTGWALFMLAWGAIAVSGSDNIVRPLLIQRGSAMPLGLIILGVFGGLIAFGFLGLFVGPALLAVAHGLLRAWKEARPA